MRWPAKEVEEDPEVGLVKGAGSPWRVVGSLGGGLCED